MNLYHQLAIPSKAHFCERLYHNNLKLQGYWLDESHERTVLIESGDVYLIQKPNYKLDDHAIVPEKAFCKWNQFKYIQGLNLESKLTFDLLRVHKVIKEFVFQDTKNQVYFTSNHKWVKFQAKYPTSFTFDPEHQVVMSFYFVHNATLLLLHKDGWLVCFILKLTVTFLLLQ